MLATLGVGIMSLAHVTGNPEAADSVADALSTQPAASVKGDLLLIAAALFYSMHVIRLGTYGYL